MSVEVRKLVRGDAPQLISTTDNQEASFQRKYDFWPSFYQNTLFSKQDVVEARNGDFQTRILFASQCKQRGDECFVTKEFNDAINEYERSLSMFCWVEPSQLWSKEAQDIEDEELKEFSYIAGNADEKKEMATLQVSSYLNLAACYQKTKDWANSFEACNYAISIDSSSGRAYFRRAQARILPGCTGGVGDEELLALCDLKVAHQLSPDNQEIARTYVNLSLAIQEHRKKEKGLYKKAFKKSDEPKIRDIGSDMTGGRVKNTKIKNNKQLKNSEPSKKSSVKAVQETPNDDIVVVHGSSNGSDQVSVKSVPLLKPITPFNGNFTDPHSAAMAQASLKAALLTIKEAINRIKEVEDRAAELSKEGRHAEAQILSDKAKIAKLHIESMHVQQAKAAKIQREYYGEQESNESNMGSEVDGRGKDRGRGGGGGGADGKELGLRGNLFAVDFLYPSPTIIEDARSQGLDLTDKRARRIMYELQKEAGISKTRALKWLQTGTPKENPEGKDDFVARVIDRVYREESRELAGKLVDGLSRGVLLGMLRSRRLSPPVEMGDSSYYALTADARQLAAVVIAGAGAGVLTGLSTYEVALANVKQEKKVLQVPLNAHTHTHTHTTSSQQVSANSDRRESVSATGDDDRKVVHSSASNLYPSSNTLTQDPCSKGNMIKSECVTACQEGSVITVPSMDSTYDKSLVENGSKHNATCVDTTRLEEDMKVNKKDVEGVKRDKEEEKEKDKEKEEEVEDDDEATKNLKLQRIREKELENEKECDCPLDDMSKDELKERILPFLAGDLFLIWRETDLATEKEKIRIRNKQLQIVEDNEGVSEAVIEDRRRLDAMTYDERTEHEKDKREEVVYTMLQEKYGLDEEKITDDAERLRKSSKASVSRLRSLHQDLTSPYSGMIMGALTFITLLAMYTFLTVSQHTNTGPPAHSIHSAAGHTQW